MIPNNYTEFINDLTYQCPEQYHSHGRINDAVRQILRVKFTMGLFENPYADLCLVGQVGKKEHRDMVREAVRKSIVLLKNDNDPKKPVLPLPKRMNKILVAGSNADNLGNQCGEWTISWQGLISGNNNTIETPILEAIKNIVDPASDVVDFENPESDFVKYGDFSCAIILVGEIPYAESMGDNMNLTMPAPGQSTINNVCGSIQCIVGVISGRPMVIESYVRMMDALGAAWLRGTESQGVANVLFGDYGYVASSLGHGSDPWISCP